MTVYYTEIRNLHFEFRNLSDLLNFNFAVRYFDFTVTVEFRTNDVRSLDRLPDITIDLATDKVTIAQEQNKYT